MLFKKLFYEYYDLFVRGFIMWVYIGMAVSVSIK